MRTPDDAIKLRSAVDTETKRAVVVGGGFIGLSSGEFGRSGVKVFMLEMASKYCPVLIRRWQIMLKTSWLNRALWFHRH